MDQTDTSKQPEAGDAAAIAPPEPSPLPEPVALGLAAPGKPAAPMAEPLAVPALLTLQNVLGQSGGPVIGRRYGFLCAYCSSRLEAMDAIAGQTGSCPTCGKDIVIPLLDRRGRLIDPSTGQVLKQDPLPMHAYAAAGDRAPLIVAPQGPLAAVAAYGAAGNARPEDMAPMRVIECPRCHRQSPLAANHCAGCGLPFTMEGTASTGLGATNGLAVAALVLGILSVTGGCALMGIPPLLAIIFGVVAAHQIRSDPQARGGMGLAIAGIVLGSVGLLLAGAMFLSMIMR
jgi:hypothetical protein